MVSTMFGYFYLCKKSNFSIWLHFDYNLSFTYLLSLWMGRFQTWTQAEALETSKGKLINEVVSYCWWFRNLAKHLGWIQHYKTLWIKGETSYQMVHDFSHQRYQGIWLFGSSSESSFHENFDDRFVDAFAPSERVDVMWVLFVLFVLIWEMFVDSLGQRWYLIQVFKGCKPPQNARSMQL